MKTTCRIPLALLGLGLVAAGITLTGCSDAEVQGTGETSMPKQAIDRAQGVALESNMSQIRTVINQFRQENGRNPASMEELKATAKFPAEMFVNPVDNKPLIYDANTGQIYPDGQPYMSKQSRASAANNSDPGAPGVPNITIPQPGGGAQ